MVKNSRIPKNSYAQKLLDPRWQQKRLEILQRDDWQCASCGDFNTTLHVHHMFYSWKWTDDGQVRVKCEPWESPNTALLTLCSQCHETPNCIDQQNLLLEELYKHFPPGEDAFDLAYFLSNVKNVSQRLDLRGFTPWMIEFLKQLFALLELNKDELTGY